MRRRQPAERRARREGGRTTDIPNKIAFVWHHDDALPACLAATGHNGALIKGGIDGDQPVLWTDDAGRPP